MLFRAYPNPFDHEIWIQPLKDIQTTGEIQLLDANGRTLQKFPFLHLKEKEQVKISLDSFPLGLYILRIINDESQWAQKIVKY